MNLKVLAFRTVTCHHDKYGFTLLHRLCIRGETKKIAVIFSGTRSKLDSAIALQVKVLENGSRFAGKNAVELLTALNSHEHQVIAQVLRPSVIGLETSSLIHVAARVGGIFHIKSLIKLGANINEISSDRRDEYSTPLCLAAAYNSLPVVNFLLLHGANILVKDMFELDALCHAASRGRTQMLSFLLEIAPYLLHKRCQGLTILHFAAYGGHSSTALELLRRDAEVDCARSCQPSEITGRKEDYPPILRTNKGVTPLMLAASSKNLDLVKLLVARGANVKAQDETNSSVLFYAAEGGSCEIFKFLKEAGADVKVDDKKQQTLLHLAVNFNMAKMLLDMGLSVHAKDVDGCTPLHYAAGRPDIRVIKLLLDHGAHINTESYIFKKTALYFAIRYHCTFEKVQLLLHQGSNIKRPSMDKQTPLHWAVDRGCGHNIVKVLIDSGADVNAADIRGDTPLLLAAGMTDTDTTKLLIESGGNVNARSNGNENTPLHSSIRCGNNEIVKVLLEKGSEVNRLAKEFGNKDASNFNVVSPLHIATRNQNLGALKLLLEYRADINIQDGRGATPLHYTAKSQWIEGLRFLHEKGANLNAEDGHGATLLLHATVKGWLEGLKYLLEQGANANCHDQHNTTPLYCAAVYGWVDGVKYLLQYNADVNKAAGDDGDTPLHIAVKRSLLGVVRVLIACGANANAFDKRNNTPLVYATKNGWVDGLKFLLKNGADVTTVVGDSRETVLYVAVKNHLSGVLRLLLEQGVNVNTIAGEHRETVLHLAARHMLSDVLEILLQHGGYANAMEGHSGKTPLHFAASQGSVASLQVLVNHGGDVHARDSEGNTPLHLAVINGNLRAVRFLLQYRSSAKTVNNSQMSPWELACRYCQSSIDMPNSRERRLIKESITEFMNLAHRRRDTT